MYEIQDYLGNKIYEVSQEELNELLASGEQEKINYFQYDSNPENDLVKLWEKEIETRDVSKFRIIKPLGFNNG